MVEWINQDAGDLRRHRAHYDVILMFDDLFIHVFLADRVGTKITLDGRQDYIMNGTRVWPGITIGRQQSKSWHEWEFLTH